MLVTLGYRVHHIHVLKAAMELSCWFFRKERAKKGERRVKKRWNEAQSKGIWEVRGGKVKDRQMHMVLRV